MKPSDENYPIKPHHINTKQHFFGSSFAKQEKEVTAAWVVMCRQTQDNWGPFALADLEAFYKQKLGVDESFNWNGLDDNENITIKKGMVFIHHPFVVACFAASPSALGSWEDN